MTTQGPVTIYNKRPGQDRRDVYYPTTLSEASYAEAVGSSHGGGQTEEKPRCKLRIPKRARATPQRGYIPEDAYRQLNPAMAVSFWTLAQNDLVIRGEALVEGPADERMIRDAAAKAGRRVIVISEYADNTGRGSLGVRHWRIGGR